MLTKCCKIEIFATTVAPQNCNYEELKNILNWGMLVGFEVLTTVAMKSPNFWNTV
jgi:hypothetical protein